MATKVKAKVSAVVLTCNDDRHMIRTLSQLYWCDEIIVADGHSTDQTIALCRYYGCRIIHREAGTPGQQKKAAIGKAKNDWILFLAPGDYLTAELSEELQQITMRPTTFSGYILRARLVFREQEFLYGKESHRRALMLFSRQSSVIADDGTVKIIGAASICRHPIRHYSFSNIRQYLTAGNRSADHNRDTQKTAVATHRRVPLLLGMPLQFLKYYIIQGNALNGANGFYWSVLQSFQFFTDQLSLQDQQHLHDADDASIINIILDKPRHAKVVFMRPAIFDN